MNAPATTLFWSCELMTNFRQADVMSPDSLFQALQTDDGRSLLLSIGTDGELGAITESPGARTGWVRVNLTAALRANGATAATFAAGQNHATGAIDLMLVMSKAGLDELYVSLGNSSSDLSWLAAPTWTAVPYDDPRRPRTPVIGVFVSDAADGVYLVADVRRELDDGVGYLFRYYIDPLHADPGRALTGQAWNQHDIAADMQTPAAGGAAAPPVLSSCLGRRAGDQVDGVYTLGSAGPRTNLNYQCLYNVYNPKVSAPAVELRPPSGATALAAVRMQRDATDLYVIGGQTLYRYACDAQADRAAPAALATHAVFAGATQLHAFATAERVVLWGHSRAGQLFSTWCPVERLSDAAAWTYPVPLLAQVEQVSPYLNRGDGGNTFFAHSGRNELTKLVQDPVTTSWIHQKILLPPPLEKTATPFSSYTTHLRVANADSIPMPGATLQVSASRRVGVTVNGHYMILAPTPIPVTADPAGALVVIEPAQGLQGTTLTVSTPDGTAVTINPMDAPLGRAAALGSPDTLSTEQITDDQGGRRPLLVPGTSDSDRDAVARAVQGLSTAYTSLPAGAALSAAAPAAPVLVGSVGIGTLVTAARPLSRDGFAAAVEVAAGDLLQYLEQTADYIVHIVQDAVDGAWHLVCEIAGETLRFVLDAAQKVAGALETVFAAVGDIVDYLKFVFDWTDITRTKDVLKNVFALTVGYGVRQLGSMKSDVLMRLEAVKADIDGLAAIAPGQWQASIEGGTKPLGAVPPGADLGPVLSSPGHVLGYHLTGNISESRPANTPAGVFARPDDGRLKPLIDRVWTALKDEGNVFTDALDRIQATLLDGDAYATMPLETVIVKLAAIVNGAAVNTAEVFLGLLVDLLTILAESMMEAIAEPLWIPVVSDMLEYFGITIETSILDIICYVAAVAVTTVYKLMTGRAPFTADDGFSGTLIAATELDGLAGLMSTGSTS